MACWDERCSELVKHSERHWREGNGGCSAVVPYGSGLGFRFWAGGRWCNERTIEVRTREIEILQGGITYPSISSKLGVYYSV